MPFLSHAINQNLQDAALFYTAVGLLGILGNVLVGRCSDLMSRKAMLWVACACSLASNLLAVAYPESLLPLIPGSFAQFFGVLKALIGDYCLSMDADAVERSRWISSLSLLTFLATFIGPMAAGLLASSLQEINLVVLVADILSVPCMLLITGPEAARTEAPKSQEGFTWSRAVKLKVLKSPAAVWMLLWILLLAIGYHAFNTIMMPSLTTRFSADAAMHGQLLVVMGLGGFVGTALSQLVIRRCCRPHPTSLISGIVFFLCIARFVAFTTEHFSVVLAAYFCLFASIGVINVVKPMIWMNFTGEDELGGVFGLQESIEGGLAVVLGPMLAGIVGSHLGPEAVFVGLVAMWAALVPYAYFGYPRYVIPASEQAALERKGKTE